VDVRLPNRRDLSADACGMRTLVKYQGKNAIRLARDMDAAPLAATLQRHADSAHALASIDHGP
jgi:hypothetical protein